MADSSKFDDIAYLSTGNATQQQVHNLLTRYQLMEQLNNYQPLLVGTIPIDIAIESSDLDIICCYAEADEFESHLRTSFCSHLDFDVNRLTINNQEAISATFIVEGWPIEIFGQQILTKQQNGYRHMIAEYNLLGKYGEAFRQEVINLKQQGFKTEPAFARALQLTGDPYEELLKFC